MTQKTKKIDPFWLCDLCQEEEATVFVWVPRRVEGEEVGGGVYKIACPSCKEDGGYKEEDCFPLEPDLFDIDSEDIGSGEGGQ